MEKLANAQPGDKLILVSVEDDKSGRKVRLQIVGSEPPDYRTINVDREPTLRINGFETTLEWMPDAGGCFVSTQNKAFVHFSELPVGTEIEVLSYVKPVDWNKPVPVFDENKPHTLADFVTESMKYGICVEGLPAEVKPSDAAKIFGAMRHVDLKPVCIGDHYFYGWFPAQGKKVQTVGGIHLFTIISTELMTKGHRLIVESAALELLRQ